MRWILLSAASLRRVSTVGCAFLLVPALAHAQTSNTAQKPSDQPASKSTTHHSTTTSPTTSSTTHRASTKKKKSRRTTASWRKRGQQKIDTQRTRAIQEALIREHYLTGEPSGAWDATTQKAMQRYQADNGWQDKSTPDSRALIKLGLGPDNAHLLNPDSAMTSAAQPAASHAGPPATAAAAKPLTSAAPASAKPATSSDPTPSPAPPQQH